MKHVTVALGPSFANVGLCSEEEMEEVPNEVFSDVSSDDEAKRLSTSSCAQAAVVGTRSVSICKAMLDGMGDELEMDGADVVVGDDGAVVEEMERRKVMYGTCSAEHRRAIQAGARKTEGWLKHFFGEVAFLEGGRRCGVFAVRFRTSEQETGRSTEVLGCGEWVLPPLNLKSLPEAGSARGYEGVVGGGGDLRSREGGQHSEH